LNLESSKTHNSHIKRRRIKDAGFTLIELLLVISLISLMLFFAIPRFQGGIFANTSRRSTILLKQTIEGLKQKAVEEQKTYALHLNLDTHHFWITNEAMDEETSLEALRKGTDLSDALYLKEVAFSLNEKFLFGEVNLYFYPKGYSDRARIHLQLLDGTQTTLLVEPFLAAVRIEEDYVSFR
jgi:prepilin-type N-terminal cleavage/methylation domain-containing protein